MRSGCEALPESVALRLRCDSMRIVLLLALTGCADMAAMVSDRARNDFSCDDVSVSDQGGGEWHADGCGRSSDYTCVYGDTGEFGGKHTAVCAREGNLDTTPAPVYAAASPTPTTPGAPAPSSSVRSHFPLTSAVATMRLAASFAEDCNAVEGPRGTGNADVVFGGDGHVASVTLSAPFQGTAVGECVANKFRRVVLPAFEHGPKKTSKSFQVPALPATPAAPKPT